MTPCPWCGGTIREPGVHDVQSVGLKQWWVKFYHDGSCCIGRLWFEVRAAANTAEEAIPIAIAKWNRRALLSTADSEQRETWSPEEQLADIVFNPDGETIGRQLAHAIMMALRADYHGFHTALCYPSRARPGEQPAALRAAEARAEDMDDQCSRLKADLAAAEERVSKAERERDEALRDVKQLEEAAMETEDKLEGLRRDLATARADLEREKEESDVAVEELRGRLAEERGKLKVSEHYAKKRWAWLDANLKWLREKDAKLAASSLANAVLRTALERMVNLYESEQDVGSPWSRPAWLLSALALPADSLAQEVVKALREAQNALTYRVDSDEQHEVIGLLDALLEKLGYKP